MSSQAVESMDTLDTKDTQTQSAEETKLHPNGDSQTKFIKRETLPFHTEETKPFASHGGNIPDAKIRFSITEDIGDDEVYCWPTPDFLTESLFHDFLVEIVEIVSERNTKKVFELIDCNSASWDELRKWNQRQNNWSSGDRIADIGPRVRKRCSNEKSIAYFISLFPPEGNIQSIEVRINTEIDPFEKLRRKINHLKASRESETIEEDDEGQDICLNEEEEHIDKDVQVNPEKPCYYPSQEMMAAILKKRIDTIMQYYHTISSLGDAFNNVEFVVYTARYRMLSDQTEKRIRHPEAGVLSKEELETLVDSDSKKRMFMYILSDEAKDHFRKLKEDVRENPETFFVIIADECHWGITKDKEDKSSAHNLFINEWCKDNSPKNVMVVQISATPFNLLTKNSRLPEVRCILRSKTSTTYNDADYQEDDLIVLKEEENVEKHSKEVDLHVVHWSEVELKNFESGMQMKLKSALSTNGAPYQYLHVSSNRKLVVTPTEKDATNFIVQGSHGIVILKVLAAKEQEQTKTLTVGEDAYGNLEAKDDPQKSSKFEIKLEFGVGIVAFCSCEKPDHYIAVNEIGQVSLQAARVKRKWGVSKIEPKYQGVKVSCEFYTDDCRPAKADMAWQQYMSLNYYLSTINCSNKKSQKIRVGEVFKGLVEKADISNSSSFPIDALLCAEYCYYIIHLSVYDSDEKIRQALTSDAKESPASEFDKRLDSFLYRLKRDETTCIHPEAFELVREQLCDEAASVFRANLKEIARLESSTSSKRKHEILKESEHFEKLVSSFVACLMYLPQQKMQEIIEEKFSPGTVEDIKRKLQENNCQAMIKAWNSIVEESETFSLVTNLIHSGKGNYGKMKIVRARSKAAADQFYNTLQLVRELSCLEECFEVIRDYGGIQIEKQMMKVSSPFFQKLQPDMCMYKSDCGCSERVQQPRSLKCANCDHVHMLITQYEDLQNLACVLILVEKGRMGDTFPQSFDCLDLRLNYDSSHLSTLIQELGRLCRYVKVSVSEGCVGDTPYVLVGPELFKTLEKSLAKSPSMNAVSCSSVDRYMTKIRGSKYTTSYSWRWPDYEAQKDSFDYQNQDEHKNRILLQAEPQIGKTGAYLCLIKLLRQDIVKDNKVSSTSTAAFDEGILYCHKDCHCSVEVVINDNDGKDDWQFPYWETVQGSPGLSEKPVKEGKYSIGGQFYTHEMKEFPYDLINPEQPTMTKSIPHPVKSDCRDDMRAWHWYHFKNCFQCRRHLQDKTSVLETIEVKIDDVPIRVKCSVPNNQASYEHLLEQLKSTKPTEEAFSELNVAAAVEDAPTLAYWIFHPSHRDDPGKCTLNYYHVMQESGEVANYVQIVVVRSEKFESYRSFWGKMLAILELPDELPGCKHGPVDGGVGYARLFIQKVAYFLRLEYVFVIDDNVVVMKEAEFESSTDDIHVPSTEGSVSRKGNGVMRMKRCSFFKPLRSLEKIAQGKDTPPRKEEEYKPHPLKEQFPLEASRYPLYTYAGPAKLFQDKQREDRQHDSYGVLGLLRSLPNAVKPFSKTQVYAVILLNVQSTVQKKVFYRPWPFWEDLRFNDDCDEVGLWVVKCNRYHFQKFQYNDWLNRLVLPSIFEWKDDTILEDRPHSSKIPKDLEEDIILEHLRNFVNNQGPGKCFKKSIGYDSQKDSDDTVSPVRIVQQVGVTNEADAKEIPVLIISYCVTNSEFETKALLYSTFCSTKEKIVFVASAEEAIEEWPHMKIATMPTKKGICFYKEMEQRNATFAIFSAADPTKYCLRYILIEASFPQDKTTKEEASNCTAADNQAFASGVSNVKKNTSSESLKDTNIQNKGVKRCLHKQSNDPVQTKKRKAKDGCSPSDPTHATGALSNGKSIIKHGKGHLSRHDTNERKKGGSKSVTNVKGEGGARKTFHPDSEVQLKTKTKRMKVENLTEEVHYKEEGSGFIVIEGQDTWSGAERNINNETSPSEPQKTLASGEGQGQTEAVNLMQDEERAPKTNTNNQRVLSPKTDDEGNGERDSPKVPVRKQRSRNSTKINLNDPAYVEGTNNVTGKLVELWRKYREIQNLSKKMQREQLRKTGLTEEEVGMTDLIEEDVRMTDITEEEESKTDLTEKEVHKADLTEEEVRKADLNDGQVPKADITEDEVCKADPSKKEKHKKDLTKKEVADALNVFYSHELQAADKKGYNALLKACSLPTMSPHVMQYLITSSKLDLNCRLPPNFDSGHPARKELVPGMSALSLAIRGGNVKSVPTFMKRLNDIDVRSKDRDGNTALHHCFLALSKTSYEKLFPLFKPLPWMEMRNDVGMNPLDVCVSQMKLERLGKDKEKFLNDAREEMEKVLNDGKHDAKLSSPEA